MNHSSPPEDILDGRWQGARQSDSPNFNERPTDALVSLLVIHNISLPPGCYDGDNVEDFFLNRLRVSQHAYFKTIQDLKVSAHCFVRRSGEAIQFVPFHLRAWHAGRSTFGGQSECNDYSIGVEMEGTDTEPYTDQQYTALIRLTRAIMREYPTINVDRVVGHSDVAPERKTDPGPAFDWARYKLAISES